VTDGPNLTGKVVGITADRRGDDQAVMFSRLGAEVVLGPTMATVKVPDPESLRERTLDIIDHPPDYVVANTGIGIRTWMDTAERWGLGERLRGALRQSRLAARGPKAAGALSSSGLTTWWRSPSEQLAEVIDHLVEEGLDGRTVAFQLHGDDGAEFVARMEAAGARVATVPVYVWQLPTDTGPARELIERIGRGRIDAITFTAGPQIRALVELADRAAPAEPIVAALNRDRVVVGCIGPVCAAVARAAGVEQVVVPDHWRLGSLVKAVAEALTT
jgi:uroporphyrinogen-III synthase